MGRATWAKRRRRRKGQRWRSWHVGSCCVGPGRGMDRTGAGGNGPPEKNWWRRKAKWDEAPKGEHVGAGAESGAGLDHACYSSL